MKKTILYGMYVLLCYFSLTSLNVSAQDILPCVGDCMDLTTLTDKEEEDIAFVKQELVELGATYSDREDNIGFKFYNYEDPLTPEPISSTRVGVNYLREISGGSVMNLKLDTEDGKKALFYVIPMPSGAIFMHHEQSECGTLEEGRNGLQQGFDEVINHIRQGVVEINKSYRNIYGRETSFKIGMGKFEIVDNYELIPPYEVMNPLRLQRGEYGLPLVEIRKVEEVYRPGHRGDLLSNCYRNPITAIFVPTPLLILKNSAIKFSQSNLRNNIRRLINLPVVSDYAGDAVSSYQGLMSYIFNSKVDNAQSILTEENEILALRGLLLRILKAYGFRARHCIGGVYDCVEESVKDEYLGILPPQQTEVASLLPAGSMSDYNFNLVNTFSPTVNLTGLTKVKVGEDSIYTENPDQLFSSSTADGYEVAYQLDESSEDFVVERGVNGEEVLIKKPATLYPGSGDPYVSNDLSTVDFFNVTASGIQVSSENNLVSFAMAGNAALKNPTTAPSFVEDTEVLKRMFLQALAIPQVQQKASYAYTRNKSPYYERPGSYMSSTIGETDFGIRMAHLAASIFGKINDELDYYVRQQIDESSEHLRCLMGDFDFGCLGWYQHIQEHFINYDLTIVPKIKYKESAGSVVFIDPDITFDISISNLSVSYEMSLECNSWPTSMQKCIQPKPTLSGFTMFAEELVQNIGQDPASYINSFDNYKPYLNILALAEWYKQQDIPEKQFGDLIDSNDLSSKYTGKSLVSDDEERLWRSPKIKGETIPLDADVTGTVYPVQIINSELFTSEDITLLDSLYSRGITDDGSKNYFMGGTFGHNLPELAFNYLQVTDESGNRSNYFTNEAKPVDLQFAISNTGTSSTSKGAKVEFFYQYTNGNGSLYKIGELTTSILTPYETFTGSLTFSVPQDTGTIALIGKVNFDNSSTSNDIPELTYANNQYQEFLTIFQYDPTLGSGIDLGNGIGNGGSGGSGSDDGGSDSGGSGSGSGDSGGSGSGSSGGTATCPQTLIITDVTIAASQSATYQASSEVTLGEGFSALAGSYVSATADCSSQTYVARGVADNSGRTVEATKATRIKYPTTDPSVLAWRNFVTTPQPIAIASRVREIAQEPVAQLEQAVAGSSLPYPVPFHNKLHIRVNPAKKVHDIQILNLTGRPVLQQESGKMHDQRLFDFDTHDLASGQYIMLIRYVDGTREHHNIVK